MLHFQPYCQTRRSQTPLWNRKKESELWSYDISKHQNIKQILIDVKYKYISLLLLCFAAVFFLLFFFFSNALYYNFDKNKTLADSTAVLKEINILRVTMTEMKSCLQHSLNNGWNFSRKYLLWNVCSVSCNIKSK